jgi:DNA-binding CsgD family transcriptional regulator
VARVSATLLELIGEVQGLLDLDEFRAGLMAAVLRAVPSDWISLNDLGPDPETAVVLVDPELSPEALATFARLSHENPLLGRYQRTLDGRAYRFSDVVTPGELHRLELYREFYAPLGVEHQIAFTLPHEPTRLLALALSRNERDFSDAERDLLNEARPFLIQAYRNAIEHSRVHAEFDRRVAQPTLAVLIWRGLTRREAEVLFEIVAGRSNRGVADALRVHERTIEKHLERCYRKLEVHSRAEAAALTWSLVEAR